MASDGADTLSVPGQNFVLLSYVGPDTGKCDFFAVKISGVFATESAAHEHCRKLQKEDPRFNRYVAAMYNFLPFPPPETMEETHYTDKRLDDLMKGHADSQRAARKHFKARKDALMNGAIDPSDENADFYTKDEVAPVSHPADHIEKLRAEHPDKSQKELVEMADALVAEEIESRRRAQEIISQASPLAEASSSSSS